VMRAMALAFPDDLAADRDLQYLLGPSLLVAPVVRADGRVRVVLPSGSRWCELATGTWHEGGTVLDLEVPLDTIPLFGREGHLLPLGPVVQHTGELDGPLVVDEVVAFGAPTVPLDLPVVDADGRVDATVTLAPDGAGGLTGLGALTGAPTLTVR